uniref:EGF-like domain-containing protein n=1 Tax=Chromera velia CCMP2878 TaxID=1169474 RepID=A0A0G4EZ83_9ALVE|eukprot:Cvel_14251.t1-p1 / transcript=Cvel_14251.t1 / gene=Cvel_14251 / organism=Chromera_velia_CCMP2878 / gene_product=Fibrillin-1, putative / transcript_product=Fibrillin-1, putative / location=Cvel_scaffold1006:8777-18316(-) / protein_length=1745 / sequence_SO=supercontig / SO=protein_coding / is_pseudo=false
MLRFESRILLALSFLSANWNLSQNSNRELTWYVSSGVRSAAANSCSYPDAGDGTTCTTLNLLPPSDIGIQTDWTQDNSVQLSGQYSIYKSYTGTCAGQYRALTNEDWASDTGCCAWSSDSSVAGAFDRTDSTNWHVGTGDGSSSYYAPGIGAGADAATELWIWLPCYTYLYWYAVKARIGAEPYQTPSVLDVYGSTDQSTSSASWTLIGSYSGETGWTNGEVRSFSTTDSTTAYRAFRFHLKRISQSANFWMSTSEIYLYGDIDECTNSIHDCHTNAACTNSVGSFTCACNNGYSGGGVSCTNIDECTTGAHNCGVNAECTDSAGSFACSCPSGFEGDPINFCANEDECSSGTHTCPSISTCVNTLGGFECIFPTTIETSVLEEEVTADEGTATNVQTMEALTTLTSSKLSDTSAISRTDAAGTVDAVAVRVSNTLSLASSSGRKLATEESKAIRDVLVAAGQGLSKVFEESSTEDEDEDTATNVEEKKDAQTKAAAAAVDKLASSLSDTISLSEAPSKTRTGKDAVKNQLPILKSLESVLENAASDAGVTAGSAGDVDPESIQTRRDELHSATQRVIKVATEFLGPQVLLQAGAGGASELTTDSFSLSGVVLGDPTAVADAGTIRGSLGSMTVTIPKLPVTVRDRLRNLSCGDPVSSVLGLVAVGWSGDVRGYVGGERQASSSQSLRLYWCGREVGREVFGEDRITVSIEGIGSGDSARRRRLQEEGGEEGCASFDENEVGWSSLCSAGAGGGCECEGAGGGLMETEYGSFVGDVLAVAAGADLSVIWRVDKFGEGARMDNIALWLVVILVGSLVTHLMVALLRDRRSPRATLSILESAYLSNKPVLAAAWDGRHRPPCCSLAFLQMQVERLAEEGVSGNEGRYQHRFSNECAYPLTASDAEEVPSEFDEYFEGLGMLAFRQTDLVALLTADAQKLLSQGVGSNTSSLGSHREIVVVSPELCLLEDRRLLSPAAAVRTPMGRQTNTSRVLNPLWDPRPPPVLPFSLRSNLGLRWKRDLSVDPIGEEDWELLSAARFLIRSGTFRKRLEGLAERQARRWQLVTNAVRRWKERKRKKDGENEKHQIKEASDDINRERHCFSLLDLRGFLLPWPPTVPELGSDEWKEAVEHGTDLVDSSGEGEKGEKQEGRGEGGLLWTSESVSVRLEVKGSFLKISAANPGGPPLSGAIPPPLLKERGAGFLDGAGARLGVIIPSQAVLSARLIKAASPAGILKGRRTGTVRGGCGGRKVETKQQADVLTEVAEREWRVESSAASLELPSSSSQEKVEDLGQTLCPSFCVHFLEERPDVSVLRLFIKCKESPSGVVGLDISVLSVSSPGNQCGSAKNPGGQIGTKGREGKGEGARMEIGSHQRNMLKSRVGTENVHISPEEREQNEETLRFIGHLCLKAKACETTALRRLPVWRELEEQVEEDVKRVRFFGWGLVYLQIRLFILPLSSMFLGGNHTVLPGVSRVTQALHQWTMVFTWEFLLLLFFGVLSSNTPELSSDLTAMDVVIATLSSFSDSSLLGVLFVYALTIHVGLLADFLLKPHTPEVRELKDISALAKKGNRITLDQTNLLWASSTVANRGLCRRRKNKVVVPLGLSILSPAWQREKTLERIVQWRRRGTVGQKGDEKGEGTDMAAMCQATKQWILPEAFRAFWLFRQNRRRLVGISFCVFWMCVCVFYTLAFALVYPIDTSNVVEMGNSALTLLLINGVVRPLFLAAGLGVSFVFLLAFLQRPGVKL